MSFWEYQCAIEGWIAANNPDDKPARTYPTDEEAEAARNMVFH